MRTRTPILLALAALTFSLPGLTQQPPVNSPRNTPLVGLIRSCLPTVVSIRTLTPHQNPGTYQVRVGSGSVLHETGYLLTNEHVIAGAVRGDATLHDGRTLPYRVIARFAHEDLAILKIDAGSPLTALKLGRSHDLMLGEPTLVIGNPGGLPQSVSTGIVSGLNRATNTENAFLPSMIQTSAAVSGGSSGGPLINAVGEQIGVVTSKKADLENVNFAIAIDRVRTVLRPMLAIEERYGLQIDIGVDPLAATAQVVSIVANSPSAQAGIQLGDVIVRIGTFQIGQALDYYLALIDRQPGQPLQLELLRDQQPLTTTIEPAPAPGVEPLDVAKVVSGLDYMVSTGRWDRLPAWSKMTPVARGRTDRIQLGVHPSGGDYFAIRFSGFIRAPRNGMYTFSTTSDDGSRLYIANRLIVDNDGLHAPRTSAGHVRLKTGLYPLRVEFFEHTGGESLQAFWSGPGLPKQEIDRGVLFVPGDRETPPEPSATRPANSD